MDVDNPYSPPGSVIGEKRQSTQLASRWLRLAGALIDGLVVFAIVFPIMFLSGYFEKALDGEQTLGDTILFGAFGLAVSLLVHGYFLAKEGQTIAKKLLGMRIVSVEDGQILPLWKVYGLRYIPLAIVAQIPLVGTVTGLANALFIFGEERRCIHDYIAGTKVVMVKR